MTGPGAVLAVCVCVAGCTGAATAAAPVAATAAPPPSTSTPSPAPTPSASPAAVRTSSRASADALAGLRSHTVTWTGGGMLRVVPAPTTPTRVPGSSGRLVRVRVEVEKGVDVDRAAFAGFVLDTLNDRRSWRHDGYRFAPVAGAYDVRVVLASPATSAAMCRPLQTFGKLSCGQGSTAVLTMYRWVKAIPEYAKDPTGYRHYVVNHEVGHTLGHGHQHCPGRGKRAPVMMQQTKGLLGCRPNPWPYP